MKSMFLARLPVQTFIAVPPRHAWTWLTLLFVPCSISDSWQIYWSINAVMRVLIVKVFLLRPPYPTKEKHELMSEDFASDSKVVDDSESASHGPATPEMLEQEPPENSFFQDSQIKLGKHKRNSLDVSPRTSKRLAGLEHVKLPLSGLNEQPNAAPLGPNVDFSSCLTVNAAVSVPQQHDSNVNAAEAPRDTDPQLACLPKGKDGASIAATSEVPITHQLDPNASADIAIVTSAVSGEVPITHQLDANVSSEIVSVTCASIKSPTETDLGINRVLCSQEQAVQQGQVTEEPEYNIPSSQGSLWSDPCFSFAYKTLTEEIPVANPVASHPFFQGDIFWPNFNASIGPSAVTFPPMSQNNVPTNSDLFLNRELMVHSASQSSHSTFLPHANANAVNFPPTSQNIVPTSLDLFLNRDFRAQSSNHSAFLPPTNTDAPGSSNPGSQFLSSSQANSEDRETKVNSTAPHNSGNFPFWLFK